MVIENSKQIKERVAVLMGGTSAERDISLKSGRGVLAALQNRGVDAFAIDVDKNIIQQLLAEKIDKVFIALHGSGGEDGLIQGVLETLRIPYTGSGVMASALSMDKLRSKQIWQAMGLATPAYQIISRHQQHMDIETIEVPVIVKPIREGSSLGMSKVVDSKELQQAITHARQYDNEVLVEEWINGKEFTVAIQDKKALPAIEMRTDNTFYDYEAKYVSDNTQYFCPCGLSEEKERELKEMALQAFFALGCSGWGRVDVMQDTDEKFWLLEVNTVPGMTDHSLVPMAAKVAGMSMEDFVWQVLQQASLKGY